jgi:hypothetical protein
MCFPLSLAFSWKEKKIFFLVFIIYTSKKGFGQNRLIFLHFMGGGGGGGTGLLFVRG